MNRNLLGEPEKTRPNDKGDAVSGGIVAKECEQEALADPLQERIRTLAWQRNRYHNGLNLKING